MTNEQIEYISLNSEIMYVNQIAEYLGLGYDRVYNFIVRNNLKRKKVQPRNKPKKEWYELETNEHTWLI